MDTKVEENYQKFVKDLNCAEEYPGDRKIIRLLTKGLLHLNELKQRKSVFGEVIPDMRERYRNYIN